ncbi:hypothetical protein BKA70DRAFT_1424597 [Coprinopsis sp. MPI-PUGE-AT-0042]|nr:hypothetical protein BKA70DRAFT_1424597 [Coprinopsis sp. MPI-PUGE-AT-0042]
MAKAKSSHLTSAQRRYNRNKSNKSYKKNNKSINARRRASYHNKKQRTLSEEASAEQEGFQLLRAMADDPEARRKEARMHSLHAVANVKKQEIVFKSLCGGDARAWVENVCQNSIVRKRSEPGVAWEILKAHISKFKRIVSVVISEQQILVDHAGTAPQLDYVEGVASSARQMVGWLEEIDNEPMLLIKYKSRSLKFFE